MKGKPPAGRLPFLAGKEFFNWLALVSGGKKWYNIAPNRKKYPKGAGEIEGYGYLWLYQDTED